MKTAETPLGSPGAESVTGDVNPAAGVIVMVTLPLPPGATVSEELPSESANGAAVMVNATGVVLVTPPEEIENARGCAPVAAVPDALRNIVIDPGVDANPLAITPAGSPDT